MANWYVRPNGGSYGAENGTDWTNAYDGLTDIVQASLSAGDTVWLAGGTYTLGVNITKGGTAGNPVTYKRVLATDAVPVAAAGWSAGFDSTVIIAPSGDAPFEWQGSGGSYVTIDGRMEYGIELAFDNSADAFLAALAFNSSVNVSNIIVQYCDMHGPGGSTDFNYQGDNGVINFRAGTVTNLTVSHCAIHGAANLFYCITNGVTGMIVENCDLYDNRSSNGAIHANIFYNNSSATNFTFRYNYIHNWQVEGFLFWADANDATWYFYGNVWYDQSSGSATCFWPGSDTSNQNQGPIFLYNNTFVDVVVTSGQSRSWDFKAGSECKNNIFYNSALASNSDFSAATASFNAFSDATGFGTNKQVNITSAIFTNYAGDNFDLASNTTAGTDLGSPYNTDINGNTRTTWSRGAFEFESGAPSVTLNLTTLNATTLKIG